MLYLASEALGVPQTALVPSAMKIVCDTLLHHKAGIDNACGTDTSCHTAAACRRNETATCKLINHDLCSTTCAHNHLAGR